MNRWYIKGAAAGRSGKYGDMYDAWGKAKGKPTRGTNAYTEAQEYFYEGFLSVPEKNPKIPSRLTPARIKVGRKVVNGMVKKINGRVKVYVTPATLKKNPSLKRRVKK